VALKIHDFLGELCPWTPHYARYQAAGTNPSTFKNLVATLITAGTPQVTLLKRDNVSFFQAYCSLFLFEY